MIEGKEQSPREVDFAPFLFVKGVRLAPDPLHRTQFHFFPTFFVNFFTIS